MTLKHVAQTQDFFIEIIQILSPASFNLILSDEEVGWQVVCFYYLSLKRLELVSLLRESCKHSREWASRHSILSILISGAREKEIYWVYITKSILHPSIIVWYQFHLLINPHTNIYWASFPLWDVSKFFSDKCFLVFVILHINFFLAKLNYFYQVVGFF